MRYVWIISANGVPALAGVSDQPVYSDQLVSFYTDFLQKHGHARPERVTYSVLQATPANFPAE